MKRFILLVLPLCFATAQVVSAQGVVREDDSPPPPSRGHRGSIAVPRTATPQAPRNVRAVQQPQPVQTASGSGGNRGVYNPGAGQPRINPRIYNPQPGQGNIRSTGTSGGNQTFGGVTTQPSTAVAPSTRVWTGRRGSGNWTGGGGVEGNQAWRTRRESGANWNSNNNAVDRSRGQWSSGAGRHTRWNGNHGNYRRQDWSRHHRHRTWWRSNYNRFALFGGGYYYWNSGYWYPAYGYDPYFSTYTYDAPLYAYNDMDPGQIIANVQQALQQQGYYQGELDGTFGPLTRQALLDYQRDNGLPVTGEIDRDTLGALGFE